MSETWRREACGEQKPEVNLPAQGKQDPVVITSYLMVLSQDTCAHGTQKVVLPW